MGGVVGTMKGKQIDTNEIMANRTEDTVAVIYADESYKIMGACFAVYNEMGCGFLESVYQECLGTELGRRGIPHDAQQDLDLAYRGAKLEQVYRADLVCYGKIILEIKALSQLIDDHRAQLLNYLHASKYKLGLLVNCGRKFWAPSGS